MSEKTGIKWTDATWNPVTGCDRVSEGCDHCYALTLAARLKAMGNPRYQTDGPARTSGPGFGLTLHPDKLLEPLRWHSPRMVFVNSMSDLFHPDVPDQFIRDVWDIMVAAPRHTFQILTKRPRRMASLLADTWPLPNVWLGVSAENQRWADQRIPLLMKTPAAVHFVSAEPLLGPIFLEQYPDWLIIGGESGDGHRPMNPEWAEHLVYQADSSAMDDFPGTAVFVKQDSGRYPGMQGRLSDALWARKEFPDVTREGGR
jgi:protein gp37